MKDDAKSESLRAIFPEATRALLPGFFEHAAPREEKATCGDCAMLAPAGAAPLEGVTYFRPDTKCCTFHPTLPNYLVGAILADERADMQEGRRRMRERIALRIGVSPQWIAPSRKVDVLMRAGRRSTFGRSLVLVCPYLDRGEQLCTIWRHREAVCTTFFCKYTAGADGEGFWRALRRYATWVEAVLSARAAESLLPGHREPKPLEGEVTLEELEDRGPPEAKYAALWKEWAGREEDFYLRCFAQVRSIGREGFEAIARGTEHERQLAALDAAREAMLRPKLPERLAPNAEMTCVETAEGTLVTAHNPYEPLLLARDRLDLVRMFEGGRAVAEVREELARERGAELPDEVLVGLYQHRVLVAA